MNGGLRRQKLPSGIVQILFRECIQLDKRPDAVEIGFGRGMCRLAGSERGTGFVKLDLERARIDLEKCLAVF